MKSSWLPEHLYKGPRSVSYTQLEGSSFAGLGLADYECGIISAGALLQYLLETQKNSLSNLTHITPYAAGKFMMIDSSTRRNLELCETLREKQKRGSLLWVLDLSLIHI